MNRKRTTSPSADQNNNQIVKKQKTNQISAFASSPTCASSSLSTITITRSQLTLKPYTIGQLKSVTLINFMNHSNFKIKFDSTHLQIVTGKNGSGKSAIANGICLALGARANTTGRTQNAQSFVKKNSSYAEITLVLANEGPEAYLPSVYGNEIHITRKIGIRQSLNSYRICSSSKQLKSTKKETISDILQAYGISPENPLCVLHQEIAKKFLQGTDHYAKYNFYMKASQLENMRIHYEDSLRSVDSVRNRLDEMKMKVDEIRREAEPSRRQVEIMQKYQENEKKQSKLENELKIAELNECEQTLAKFQQKLDLLQQKKRQTEELLKKKTDEILDYENRYQSIEQIKNDLELDLNHDSKGLKSFLSDKERKIKALKSEINKKSKLAELYSEQCEELEQKRRQTQQDILEYNKTAQKEMTLELQKRQIIDQLKSSNDEYEKMDREILEEGQESVKLQDIIKTKQDSLNDVILKKDERKQQIQKYQSAKDNHLKLFGIWIPDCLNEIERYASEKRFHKTPIGPIGRYVRCPDPKWAHAVERCLDMLMMSFICCDNHDEQLLINILSKYARDRPQIITMPYQNKIYDISLSLNRIKNAGLKSVYTVLEIDDITVACALIDQASIESCLLLEDLSEARKIKDSSLFRKMEKNIKFIRTGMTPDGSQIMFGQPFRIYTSAHRSLKYFSHKDRYPLTIEEIKNDMKNDDQIINDIQQTINFTKDKLNNLCKISDEKQRKIKILQKEIQTLIKEKDVLNSTLPVVVDISVEELEQTQNDLDLALNAKRNIFQETTEDLSTINIELNDNELHADNIAKKICSKEKELIDIHLRQQDIMQDKHNLVNEEKQLEKKVNDYNMKIHHENETKAKLIETKKHLIMTSNRRTNENVRSSKLIHKDLEEIKQFQKMHHSMSDYATRKKIANEYAQKRDCKKDYIQKYQKNVLMLKQLEEFVTKRKKGFAEIAGIHEHMVRARYRHFMQQNNFEGSDIIINHKEEKLTIKMGKHTDLRSLSGGERSLSTFCFLLSLWTTIYQPFRVMDEFDIYMDNEKRNKTIRMLHENTKYDLSQHIIFTPLNVDNDFLRSVNVNVQGMPDPKRCAIVID